MRPAEFLETLDQSTRARWGLGAQQAGLAIGEAVATMLAHRSVRAFDAAPVDDAVLRTMVAAAQSAATSSNLQAWSVVAVRDAATRARLAECAGNQAHVRDCPLFLAWIADLSRLDRVATRLDRHAGASAYLEMFLVAVIDAALAAQNAAIAAESLGFGTVYIGAMRNRPLEVSALLGLPERAFCVFGMCVGRPDPARTTEIKPRLDTRTVLHHERYRIEPDEAEAIASYDQRARAFQRSQRMPEQDWTEQAATRVRGPESLTGRHELFAALQRMGFDLK